MYKSSLILLVLVMLLQSCKSKKEILYFQDAQNSNIEKINYQETKIQPNDILSIIVSTPLPEAAIPYNSQSLGETNFNIEALKLQGYLVSEEHTINFPILGLFSTKDKTIDALGLEVKQRLEDGDHLKDATVNVRLLNAKITILGEVKLPGTFTFTERSITVPQALGYAGDLAITGERKDVLLIREENGKRSITHIDLTKTDWFDTPNYYVKPNDVIVVNPNNTKVKSAGFIGNAGVVLTIASLVLSSIVLISR
ncbi:polysaccharide biosynthesis/export family protein [Lacinutrix neustonica]|uniref:Polysaccharide biosynthesis/export family protein n=1 Tax=Lacinutrix neustonica TaxID=2980107 RepID=A0A9E8SCD1_9FLAO|nr:polysaccharide biosynthesis/export family protein [Lacinutrix neustonica]WAC01158.1 polysaccharide biosynthesis/export family protein [Lacinutrix neustonica]